MMLRFSHIMCLLVATAFASHHSSHHDDDHHDDDEDDITFRQIERKTLVGQIANQLQVSKNNHTIFAMKDIKLLFKKLLFQNCTPTSLFAKCNLCVSPEDVVNWYGFGSGQFNESELQDISVGIVYTLGEYVDHNTNTRDVGTVCKTFKLRLLQSDTSQLPVMFKNKYGAGNLLTQESFGKIIDNINKTFGSRLNEKKCFKTHEGLNVFNGTSISSEADLKDATTFLLTKLLNKECLTHDEDEEVMFNIGQVFYRFDRLYATTLGDKLSGAARERANKTACFNTTTKYLVDKLSLNNGSLVTMAELNGFAHSFIKAAKSECHNDSHGKQHDDHKDHDDHDDHDDHGKKIKKNSDSWQPWVGALVSIAIISVASLVGIMTVGSHDRKYFEHCISFLLSLGVSVLLCDAILHLIPHSFKLHGHDEGTDKHKGHDDHSKSNSTGSHEDPFAPDSYLWKCFAVLMGAFFFLAMELIMSTFNKGHGHSHSHSKQIDENDNDNTQKEQKAPDNHDKRLSKTAVVLVNNSVGDVDIGGDDVIDLPAKKRFGFKSITTVAWMILLGDGLHNFMDGIVIGGVYSEPFPSGLQGGVMTSIAILIHELPHELADFAVLISTGLTAKQALLLNLLSSLTAVLGGVIGIVLGTQWNATEWILAITAGLFIYISLGTMLPEVLHHPLLKTSKFLVLIDLSGIAVGLILMFLLAGYEEDLKGALKPS